MERKLKDVDDKNKRNDRIIKDNKDRIQDLEKEVPTSINNNIIENSNQHLKTFLIK